ncbi:MAG: hypothetical protein L3J47_05770 [Sulfurovum sp.]|nr:hypothetical protein [Sulfurovum sp.]
MGKRPLWFWFFTAFVIIVGLTIEIRPLHDKIFGWASEFYHFAKESIVAILVAFFLVKGKFVLKLFLKKVLFISATGLGKRYLIERVFNHHFKVYFLDHIKDDLVRLMLHIKENFMHFPLTKKIIAALAFLGSLSYVGKFMGWMLALKVIVAKIWSFLLALVLKTGSMVVYFFTDYIWGSWLAPIIEVVIFGWLLELLEKVPFLTKSIRWLFRLFAAMAQWLDAWIGRLFHHPIRSLFRWLLKQTRRLIYRFIGYKRVSAYYQLKELRTFEPSRFVRLQQERIERKILRPVRKSRYAAMKENRRERKSV